MRIAPGHPHPAASEPGSDERLDTWKEIAAFLRRSVRSARRWEKREGLPVHRHAPCRGDKVYAYRKELNDWWIADDTKPASDGRLDSWKEVAAFLGCSVRSARRWEKEEELPVRRHVHAKGDSVYALRAELDDWWISRRPELGLKTSSSSAPGLCAGRETPGLGRCLPGASGWSLTETVVPLPAKSGHSPVATFVPLTCEHVNAKHSLTAPRYRLRRPAGSA